MRILEVVQYFPPAWTFGGPVKVSYEISKMLVERGHEVVVYTSDMKNWHSRVDSRSREVDTIKVHYLKNISTRVTRETNLFIMPGMISRVRKEIKNFDVVHLHEYRTFQNIVVHRYAKKHNTPYVLQAHGELPRIMTKRRLKSLYDMFFGYRLLRDASKVVALSGMEASQYKSMGVPKQKIAIIPNGIDLSEYRILPPRGSFKKRFSIDEGCRVVLYLGRIHRIKGVDILIKAFSKVARKLDDVTLVVAGPDDGYLHEAKVLVKTLGLYTRILFTGPLFGKNKLEAYVDAYVFVVPSRYETFPMSILEAVACGTPVLLTENCSAAVHFGGEVGIVVKPDPNHLGEALLEMLQNPERQKVFKESCKTVVRDFDLPRTVEKLEKLYEEICEESVHYDNNSF